MANTFKLTAQEKADSGYTHAYQLTHADLTETATNTAQVFTLDNVVAGDIIVDCAHHLVTALEDASDGANNDTAITVGETDVDRFLVSTQINVNGTEITTSVTANSVDTFRFAFTAADTLDLTVNSMTAKALNDIDTGELWIFWKKVSLATLVG